MGAFLVLTVRVAVAAVLLVAVAQKVRGRAAFTAFVEWVGGLGVVAPERSRQLALAVIAAEATAVALIALPATHVAGLALAAVLLCAFAAAIASIVRRGTRVACRCLGGSGSRPMGATELVRNLVLATAAGVSASWAATAAPAALAPADAVLAVLLASTLALLTARLGDVVELFTSHPAKEERP